MSNEFKNYTSELLVQSQNIMEYAATNNKKSYNRLKALEEATEFTQAIIKYKTKHKDNPKKPDKIEILKEYGDLLYRGYIYLMCEFPEFSSEQLDSEINKHIAEKLTKLIDYKKQGLYKKGL